MAPDHFELCKSCTYNFSHTTGRIFTKLCTPACIIIQICMKANECCPTRSYRVMAPDYFEPFKSFEGNLFYCSGAILCHHWHSCFLIHSFRPCLCGIAFNGTSPLLVDFDNGTFSIISSIILCQKMHAKRIYIAEYTCFRECIGLIISNQVMLISCQKRQNVTGVLQYEENTHILYKIEPKMPSQSYVRPLVG